MRITIDATPLLLRSAGVKSYTYHWLRALRASAGGHLIGGFPYLRADGPLDHQRSLVAFPATFARIAALHAANYLPGALDAMLGDAGIFHGSNQIRRRPRRALSSATIHDLTVWKMPELHTEGNRRADHEFAETILKRADGLIAVSEHTRRDAIEILGLAPERVVRIYSGVPAEFFDAGASAADHARQALGVPRAYVLAVGTIEPRKNLDRLLDAWHGLPPDLRDEFELVIAGPAGWSAETTLARLRTPTSGIRYLGYIPEALLPGLTAGATLLAYPSLYEGFGFPAAQAMAAGVPVLTSNTSCLPEVVADGGIFVDPKSTDEIRAALQRALTSPDLLRTLGAAGRERAREFTWQRCAAQSLDFFERVAGR